MAGGQHSPVLGRAGTLGLFGAVSVLLCMLRGVGVGNVGSMGTGHQVGLERGRTLAHAGISF